jgi:hypothetical protein
MMESPLAAARFLGTLLRIGLRSPYLLEKRQLRLLSDPSDVIG